MQSNLFLIKLSWKNIFRHPGRSFFIAFTVALSVSIGIWIMAVFDGMNFQIERAVKNAHTGEFQWMQQEFYQRQDTSLIFSLNSEILKKIGNQAYSPELLLEGHVSGPEGSMPLFLIGRDINLTEKVLPIKDYIISGNENGLLVGDHFAKYYHYNVGDQIIFNFQDENGELKSELMPIAGIYKKNGFAFERKYAYVNHDTVQNLFFGKKEEKRYNRIVFNHLPVLQAPPELILKTWKDMNPEMYTITQFHDGMVYFFLSFMSIAILVTILTPINMVWFERLNEVVMMKIIGISNARIRPMAIYESLIMSLFSFLFATIIYLVVVGHQQKYGLDVSGLMEGRPVERGGIELLGVVHPIIRLKHFIVCGVFVFVTLTTSYYLAISSVLRRAKRL